MKKKVTMRDVAELTGFSVSTVSHVINETRFVEEETRQKIRQAIKTLNYRPNILAQSLKGKGSQTLGILIGDIRQNFFAEVVQSINFTATKAGYNVILCDAEEHVEEELFYIDVLLRKGIDGLILSPVDADIVSNELVESRMPFVQIDRKSNQYKSDFIGIDNVKSAENATFHLLEQGYQRIGFVSFDERCYPSKTRLEGFRKAVSARGLMDQIATKAINYHAENKVELITSWLLEHQDLQAIFCENDDLCHATLGAIEHLKLKIPENIGVLTFDDSRWFQYLKTPITAIRQPTEAIGRLAVETLLKRMHDPSGAGGYQNILLNTELMKRRSCGESQVSF